jgi:hypothetical protein
MTRIVTILTDNFSDWETALINSTCRGYYGFDTLFASPNGAPVISSGGMHVTPNMALEAIQLSETRSVDPMRRHGMANRSGPRYRWDGSGDP